MPSVSTIMNHHHSGVTVVGHSFTTTICTLSSCGRPLEDRLEAVHLVRLGELLALDRGLSDWDLRTSLLIHQICKIKNFARLSAIIVDHKTSLL